MRSRHLSLPLFQKRTSLAFEFCNNRSIGSQGSTTLALYFVLRNPDLPDILYWTPPSQTITCALKWNGDINHVEMNKKGGTVECCDGGQFTTASCRLSSPLQSRVIALLVREWDHCLNTCRNIHSCLVKVYCCSWPLAIQVWFLGCWWSKRTTNLFWNDSADFRCLLIKSLFGMLTKRTNFPFTIKKFFVMYICKCFKCDQVDCSGFWWINVYPSVLLWNSIKLWTNSSSLSCFMSVAVLLGKK